MENYIMEILSVIGGIIALLLGVLGFMVRKWMKGSEDNDKAILSAIENIKEQISHLQTDQTVQGAAIREIGRDAEHRAQGLEKRIDAKRLIIERHTYQISEIKEICLELKIKHDHEKE
jgi:hypothetical protein